MAYDVACEDADPAAGGTVVARVVVHAVDDHDAAVGPRRTPILESRETFVPAIGVKRRRLEQIVDRVDLDVEQDWWSSSQSGEPDAIAEWLDHIVAEIHLELAGEEVAEATTPPVTGSWGALGRD